MIFRTLDKHDVEYASTWLAEKEVRFWLDCGEDIPTINTESLREINSTRSHFCRVFTSDSSDFPIGLVGLSHISEDFCSGHLWYVLGEQSFCGQGYTSRAVSKMLTLGFLELGLRSINACTIDQNIASIRVLQRNNFRLVGRFRHAHIIEGRIVDRLLFDLLTAEHRRE